MNIDTLRSLQKRIREATGPDRELDCLIACALLGGEPYHRPCGYMGYDWVRRVNDAIFECANYTTDPDGLGACVALMRDQLPGWVLDISVNAVLGWARVQEARLPRRQFPDGGGYYERANLCLSIIDTIIAARIAVIAEEEAKQQEKAG